MSSQPSGSTTVMKASRRPSVIPAASPPPPHGTITCTGSPSPRSTICADASIPRSLPFDDPRIVEARHQHRAPRLGQLRGDRFATLGGPVVTDHLPPPAPASRRASISAHRPASRSPRACRDASPPSATPAHDCPKRRPPRLFPAIFVDCGEPMPRPAQLERADRLQCLGLESNWNPTDFRDEQRRRRQDCCNLRCGVTHAGTGRLSHKCHITSPWVQFHFTLGKVDPISRFPLPHGTSNRKAAFVRH